MITMKQDRVNKHKNCERNKEEKHCKNLARLPALDGKGYRSQVVRGAHAKSCCVNRWNNRSPNLGADASYL